MPVPMMEAKAFSDIILCRQKRGAVWAAISMGCDDTAIETEIGEHVRMEWENCDEDRRVVHYRLNGVGHEVPPNIEGGTNQLLIDFFIRGKRIDPAMEK